MGRRLNNGSSDRIMFHSKAQDIPPLPEVRRAIAVMKRSEMKEFKELLLALRARLRGDVEQLKAEALSHSEGAADAKSPTHLAELGTDAYEQDFSLRFVENDQETLNEIQVALGKIRDGSFGICDGCAEESKTKARSRIAKPRLRAIPYCRNCIKCERKREEMAL